MKCAVSEQVHNHFRKYEVEYLQFAFRWMNNLLMRELPLRCTIRLWDTYQVCRLHELPPALSLSLVSLSPRGQSCPGTSWGAEGNKAVWPRMFTASWLVGGPVGHLCLGVVLQLSCRSSPRVLLSTVRARRILPFPPVRLCCLLDQVAEGDPG